MIMTQSSDRYGLLTVIKRVENNNGHIMLLCKCDCGTEKVVRKSHLLKGEVVSCGCLKNKICGEFGETRKQENKYTLYEDYAVGTDKSGNSFKVSLEDLGKVKKYYWYNSNGYFITERKSKRNSMHRVILETDRLVDHINGDRSDNRRSNLRECTIVENSFNKGIMSTNTSGYPGVYFHKVNYKWVAYINYKGKRIHLGSFINKNEAVEARKEAEKIYFGEFARGDKANNLTEGKY